MPIKSFQAARQKLIPKRKRSLLVRDYMTRNLITFSPQQSILEVMRILIRNKISGGPVLDEMSRLVGIISEADCIKHLSESKYFNQVNPSNGAYVFGRPLFDSAVIELPMGKKFIVEATNNGDENIYIQSVTLNGEPYSKSFITHKNIVEGGTLRFLMGPKPNKKFAADQNDRPKSVVY